LQAGDFQAGEGDEAERAEQVPRRVGVGFDHRGYPRHDLDVRVDTANVAG
jgi:hypothetical protein